MVEALKVMAGVTVTSLKQIHHPKGDVYHALKSNEPDFTKFGEAYFTTVHAGVTKGWKKHTRMSMNLVVPAGEVTFYLHSEHDGKTRAVTIGASHYARLTIEPGIWVAFRGGEHELNLVLNIASLSHDSLEAENVELNQFPLP